MDLFYIHIFYRLVNIDYNNYYRHNNYRHSIQCAMTALLLLSNGITAYITIELAKSTKVVVVLDLCIILIILINYI